MTSQKTPVAVSPRRRQIYQTECRNARSNRIAHWTLDDIPWDRFDRGKLDPDILRIVKAASLVEYNGDVYARFLSKVFNADPLFRADTRRWGEDEVRHGAALGRWADMADPAFDFAAAASRFRRGYQIDFERETSHRGSRSGELIARCVVEAGTSTYYSALRDAAEEPVLQDICRRIAADEIRHYKLFYRNLTCLLRRERIGFWRRLRIALGRLAEAGDDELAYAYYAANEAGRLYDRRRCAQSYARRAYTICRRHHIAHGIALIFKAVGLAPSGSICHLAVHLAWGLMRARAAWLTQIARA